jgi:hypothetical protein
MIAVNNASSSENDVSIRQAGGTLITERISRHTVMPSPSGNRTSSTATSGSSAGIRATASAAVAASPITSRSGSPSSSWRRPSLTTS